jgi:hypothetical protein
VSQIQVVLEKLDADQNEAVGIDPHGNSVTQLYRLQWRQLGDSNSGPNCQNPPPSIINGPGSVARTSRHRVASTGRKESRLPATLLARESRRPVGQIPPETSGSSEETGTDASGASDVVELGDYRNDLWKYSGGQWTWMGGSNLADQPAVYGTQGTPGLGNIPGPRFSAAS